MSNQIGIMQGRLSAPISGRIQAFPKQTWREEFAKAQACGLDLIEWIFEADEWEKNALILAPQEVLCLSHHHGVKVVSLCADYFMDLPLIRVSRSDQEIRANMLKKLIECAGYLGVKYIGIPFVDASAIKTDEELGEIVRCLHGCLPLAERAGVQLALETSLDPPTFTELLARLDHPNVKVNYDIGNSASLGYDTSEEIEAYGKRIATIHVKDRKRGGGTVPLGTGDADFDATFAALAGAGYQGPFILQAARDGEETLLADRNVQFVRRYLEKYF